MTIVIHTCGPLTLRLFEYIALIAFKLLSNAF